MAAAVAAVAMMAAFLAAAPATATPPPDASAVSTQALQAGQLIPNRYIVVLRDGVEPRGFARGRGLNPDVTYERAMNGFAANMAPQAAEALRRNPNVLHVEADAIMTTTAPPTGIDRMDVDENNTAAIDGNPATGATDVDVAVLDTGVDSNHPDLNVAGGAGFAGAPFWIWWFCDDGTASFADVNGHGSHVSGTIGARDDGVNSGSTEVVGVAPGARIHGVKVLTDAGQGAISCIIDGVDWVTQQKLDYQNSGGATGVDFEVANMSLGGGNSQALCTAIDNSVAAGIVYAVAAGNSIQDASLSSPANCTSVVTVSAMADFDGQPGGLNDQTVQFSVCTEDKDDSTACFTNYGSTVEVAGPGVSILSTVPGGGYGTSSGTSMASPHVAGAVALYILAGNAIPNPSGPAVIAQMTASGWTVPQSSACGFTDEADGFAEPLIYTGTSCTGGPPPPVTDVAVTDVSAPASVVEGASAAVSVTVENQGNTDLTGVGVSLGTTGGTITDSPQSVDLPAGQAAILSFTWDTTGAGTGAQALTATHDLAPDDDQSNDSGTDTSNVVAAVTDVAVTNVSAPASVSLGDSAAVSVTVQNQGNTDLTGVGVSLSTTIGTITNTPQFVDLPAGQAAVLSFNWTTVGVAPGTATLTATHDLAPDDDPSNDSASTNSEVVAAVTDVAITNVSAPASVIVGDPASVSVTVENQGTTDLTGVGVSLSTTGGTITDSPQSVNLLAGQAAVLSFTWDTTGSGTGVQTLTATHGLAPDDDPSNDSLSDTSNVSAPRTDVAITNVSAPASVVQGTSTAVSVTVENQGNQALTGVSVSLSTTGGTITNSPQSVNLVAGEAAVLSFTWDTSGAAPGGHTLTATHDRSPDDDPSDDSGSDTSNVVAPPSDAHIGDLDAGGSKQGRTWTATVTIRVHDGADNPLSGATVSGNWGSPVNGASSCTTGASGSCQVSASGIRNRDKSVRWTVSNVTHATLGYDPGANHDPDGDSNGTTITVSKP